MVVTEALLRHSRTRKREHAADPVICSCLFRRSLALIDYGFSLRKVASMPGWYDVEQIGAIVWRVTVNSLDLISFPAVNREAMRHYARTWL